MLCAEACDNEFHLSGVKLCDVSGAEVSAASDASYAINVKVPVKVPKTTEALYTASAPEYEEKIMNIIPYFAWANREEGDMKVWFVD